MRQRSPPWLTYATIILLLSIIVLMVERFKCGEPCTATFESRSQLTRHRKTAKCAMFVAQTAASQAAIAAVNERQAKRPRIEEELTPFTPGFPNEDAAVRL
jgi:hypothetical protein